MAKAHRGRDILHLSAQCPTVEQAASFTTQVCQIPAFRGKRRLEEQERQGGQEAPPRLEEGREDALRLVRDLTESTSDLVAENDRLRAKDDKLRAVIRLLGAHPEG